LAAAGIAHGRGGLAEERADPFGELVVVRPVGLHAGLGLRPGTVEQQQRAVVKDVGKARQGRVAMVALAIARVLSDVQRQRAHRAEQAEEARAKPWRLVAVRLERHQRGGGEIELGVLPHADGLGIRAQGLAQPWRRGRERFDLAQHRVEVVSPRLGGEALEQALAAFVELAR
jgi:hypothetical protein